MRIRQDANPLALKHFVEKSKNRIGTMKTFWNYTGGLTTINEWQPNCWIQVTCPTEEDQLYLENEFKIPDYFMPDISDTDERARYEYDDGWMLIILRIP